ncbi:MAG TPA: phytanoyl-CoA dioxygenase family protein [Bauldia sp.]|nr:phytanoyl-CoA dioxygenase family protein [Bauldia sp.]
MLRIDHAKYDVDEIIGVLLKGDGAVVFPALFTQDVIAQARQIIMDLSDAEPPRVTHFQGKAEIDNRLSLQRRVWNLLTKGKVFAGMAEHPVIVDILKKFLGSEFIMGSIAANRILPGGPGQEPHIDYPYWDFYKRESFPIGLNTSFPMNAQLTILLDPFTEESGATAYVPGSQRDIRYPAEDDLFYERCSRMTGDPGDAVLFFGAVWHCAMPNKSNHDRTGILIEYLPKFVKPVEDMLTTLDEDFRRTMSPMMRQLLGFNYPYPQLFDEAEAKSAEGRTKRTG